MFSAVRRLFHAILARFLLRRITRARGTGDKRRTERSVLRAFRKAVNTFTAYRNLMEEAGVRIASIRNLADFTKKVPFINKQDVFGSDESSGFLSPRNKRRIASLYASSGFTRRFSVGVSTRGDEKRMAFFIEEILFRIYDLGTRDIIVINCLSLGTDIPLRTLPQVRTGLRDDSVVEMLRRFGHAFAAVVLIGEPLFLKRVMERGTAEGLAWDRMTVFVFTGSEYTSESWRGYIRSLLHQDPAFPGRGAVVSTLGVTEVGLAVLFETHDLIALRARISASGRTSTLLGVDPGHSCPLLMHYFPGLYYLETIPADACWGELCVTTLDAGRVIPLIRYRTGDDVRLFTALETNGLFAGAGLPVKENRFRSLPLAAVRGRDQCLVLPDGGALSANSIKERLFCDHEVARCISGNFRLEKAGAGGDARLLVQLAESCKRSGRNMERAMEVLRKGLPETVEIDFLPYHDFPYGFGHDFERKPIYV